MAKFYWGLNQGQTEVNVATGASDPTTNMEVTVDSSKIAYPGGIRKEDMLLFLEYVRNTIVKGNWPPV